MLTTLHFYVVSAPATTQNFGGAITIIVIIINQPRLCYSLFSTTHLAVMSIIAEGISWHCGLGFLFFFFCPPLALVSRALVFYTFDVCVYDKY
jgi:hypothetical protein